MKVVYPICYGVVHVHKTFFVAILLITPQYSKKIFSYEISSIAL
ncbi:hypothetical protein [Clostridium botulinum]|nr:hypothetical protein [Clostridium botulinum]